MSAPTDTAPPQPSTQSDKHIDAFLRWLESHGVTSVSTGLTLSQWDWNGQLQAFMQRGLRINSSFNDRYCNENNSSPSSKSSAATNVAPLIRIPHQLLITPDKIRGMSSLQSIFGQEVIQRRASESQLLCLFLIHQLRLGANSSWHPYINTLPRNYTSIEWWSDSELDPKSTQSASMIHSATQRRDTVRREWKQCVLWWIDSAKQSDCSGILLTSDAHRMTISSDQATATVEDAQMPLHWPQVLSRHQCNTTDLHNGNHVTTPSAVCCTRSWCSPPSLSEYQYAWSTVATRSCFLPRQTTSDVIETSNYAMSSKASVTTGSSCLIPFLDMLNHSSDVTVECRFNGAHYELYRTFPRLSKWDISSELFINYGSLSNQELIERYGFALLSNRHEALQIGLSRIEQFLSQPHALLNQDQYNALIEEWPSLTSDDVNSSFSVCSCSDQLPLVGTVAKSLVRYRNGLVAMPKPTSWQIQLLQACGLYEIAQQLLSRDDLLNGSGDATSSAAATIKSKPYQFTLHSCTIPFDFFLYLTIRLLSIEDVHEWLGAHQPSECGPKKAIASRSNHSATSGSAATALDQQQLRQFADFLLTQSSPREAASSNPDGTGAEGNVAQAVTGEPGTNFPAVSISKTHTLVFRRILIEIICHELLLRPDELGQSSIHQDIRAFNDARCSTSTHPHSYVTELLLIRRLSVKRLCYSILAHALHQS